MRVDKTANCKTTLEAGKRHWGGKGGGGEGYNLSAGSRNNKKKLSLPNFLCYRARRTTLQDALRRYRQSEFCATVLGKLAINDLLFLSVREARLLKIIARSSNDPPLGKRSEGGEQYSPFTRWSTIRSSEARPPPARAIQLFLANATSVTCPTPLPTRRARND